jgi:hypothetical protein
VLIVHKPYWFNELTPSLDINKGPTDFRLSQWFTIDADSFLVWADLLTLRSCILPPFQGRSV